jgi:hypothetical protein
MPHFSRSTVALFLTAALVTALHGWLRVAEQTGHSSAPVVGPLLLREPLRRQAEVRRRLAEQRERRGRARELAVAAAEGRLTLWEAAARLRELYRAAPDFPWVAVEMKFPDASDEERCCRLLITEVRSLEDPDGERARTARRLEDDLESALRQGTLSLPG